MDVLYPEHWAEAERYWCNRYADPTLLTRTRRLATTNVNESLHQKASLTIRKNKHHKTKRCIGNIQHLLMKQNFGYRKGHLLNVLNHLGDSGAKILSAKDTKALSSALRCHEIGENIGGKSRD